MTKQKKMTNVIDIEAGTYTAKVLGSGTLVCNVHDLPSMADIYDTLPDIAKQTMLHGIKQKVADGAAATHGSEAYQGMKAIWANLVAGDWNAKGGISGSSIVAEAYAATTGKTPVAAAEALSKMDEDELKKVKKGSAFKLEHARIVYERAKKAAELEAAA